MNIHIDILSMIIGFVVGYAILSVVVLSMYYDDRWNYGFGIGWEEGKKYTEKKAQKSCEEGE